MDDQYVTALTVLLHLYVQDVIQGVPEKHTKEHKITHVFKTYMKTAIGTL